ncbi:MAG: (deoxy)nucleoside triphosphate pyrophosphohydrolase [Bacteroidales bacterium]|nr:(deoxy)nucleoside triphosphate pyrophosphohydrolase [Bacteroidales bacterium]
MKVTCGILQKGDKYFVAKRPADKFMGGFWEFPGGKVEDDEFESECLHREWDEELGIRIMILNEYMPITYKYPKFTIDLYAYSVQLMDDEITLKEHTEAGYFSKAELLEMDLSPADRLLVERYLN